MPHLFVASTDLKFSDPKSFPWSMGWAPPVQVDTPLFAKYVLAQNPDAKIAVLYQNDDVGKDALKALKSGLGERAARLIVAEASYEITDPTVDSQIVALKGSGADTFTNFSTPKFAALAIRKVYIGWRPLHILAGASRSVAAVLRPAGLEKSVGIVTSAFLKDPTDPRWSDDPAMKEWLAWMAKYYPEGDTGEYYNVVGYSLAQTLVQVLRQCGDELTRENVMRQAANLKNVELTILIPGIRLNTTPPTIFRSNKSDYSGSMASSGHCLVKLWVISGSVDPNLDRLCRRCAPKPRDTERIDLVFPVPEIVSRLRPKAWPMAESQPAALAL